MTPNVFPVDLSIGAVIWSQVSELRHEIKGKLKGLLGGKKKVALLLQMICRFVQTFIETSS